MKNIYQHVFECIGNTPLVALSNYNHENKTNIFAKIEYFNPTGSAKDRIAKYMIDAAFDQGILKENGTIIEPTSGNTGIGLACYGRIKKCQVILTMPESMSVERRNLLKAYGAILVLTPKELGMKGAIQKAQELHQSISNSIILDQFENQANVLAHYCTTAKEIDNDTEGKVDFIVSAIGTGGSITGIGKYFKEKNAHVKLIGVEPAASPVLSANKVGSHKIQGIGAGFKPKILDLSVVDQIITVSDEDAFNYSQMLSIKEGLCVGISSGAAMVAASQIAKENPNKIIVVIFADSGQRYLSTSLYNNENE